MQGIVLPDESTLIRRLKDRDPAALTEIYDAYSALVFRLILRVVNDAGVAEDLMQEVFFRLWDRAHLIDGNAASLGPWLATVARHRAFDYATSPANRATNRTRDLEQCLHLAGTSRADQDLVTHETVKLLGEALAQLSTQQREVIQMAYFQGMTQTEIALKLRQPLGTVKSWARLGLQHLRNAMESRKGLLKA